MHAANQDPHAKTIRELAEIVGGRILRGDPARLVFRVMPTDEADEDAVTFVTKPSFYPMLAATRAAAVMLAPEILEREDVRVPDGVAIIGVERPYVAFARAAQALAARSPQPIGIHPSAVIDSGAEIGADVAIGPFVFVGSRARVAEGAVLYPGAHVEANAAIGAGSILYNHVVVRHGCKVGARCILHPGVVIGSDGFGFAQEDRCGAHEKNVKIPQLGDVEIEDDVEIGSNSCVDRAALGTTRIGAGTKIDNLVQIGHNVEIGRGCILVAQSGVAGSSRVGDGAILGAQSGISGHIEVGAQAIVLGQAGVMEDVAPKARVMGSPSVAQAEHFRRIVRVSKLDSLFSRVKKLERLLGIGED
jgi:UDP-3-O-[3-hydroxymyristoyl] glucosamine N-acyltransferase